MEFGPRAALRRLYREDGGKYFDDRSLGPVFERPMVGVADAGDPWFERLKEVIGPFHWTPQEALALAEPEAEARSVISWVLPVAEPARVANREETELPARLWAYVRTFGERFNCRLRRGLVELLRGRGRAATAPHLAPQNEVKRRRTVGISSRWSERHVAFVAGLGTFGISGGLITRRGVAHRLGSVVTDLPLSPTPRPYGDDPFAWCLREARGTCGECIERCPAGSIGERLRTRNKEACAAHTGRVGRDGQEVYGWDGVYGCGLCQAGVACEDRNPTED